VLIYCIPFFICVELLITPNPGFEFEAEFVLTFC